jgi:hypothetical protein
MAQFTPDIIKEGPEAVFRMLVEDHQIKPTWVAGFRELAMPVILDIYRWSYFFYASLFFPEERTSNLWNMINSGTPMEAVRDYAEQFLSKDEAAKVALMALVAAKQGGDRATSGFWSFLNKIPND